LPGLTADGNPMEMVLVLEMDFGKAGLLGGETPPARPWIGKS
jgi:hypothetical protein